MADWVVDILKTYGLAGVVIFALAITVGVLWQRLAKRDEEISALRDRHAEEMKAIHAQRADEREKLGALLEGVSAMQRVTNEVANKRNEIMDDLAVAMTAQASAIDRQSERQTVLFEHVKEKLGDFKHVVDSFGESNRVISGLLAEVRNAVTTLGGEVRAVAVDVKTILPGRAR